MTPFELSCYADAYSAKQDEEREKIIVLAYTTAALARSEKMPTLQSLLDSGKPKVQEVVGEEDLLEEIKRMNAAIGGVEV